MRDLYENPLNSRYAGREMSTVFSDDNRFRLWRKLWIALAESEKELGLNITDEQIAEMKKYADDINYDVAEKRENEVRHDVMAHVHTYGKCCPKAEGIIHLGATSCYVGDNTDVIVMRDAMKIVHRKLVNVLSNFASFADKYKDMPCLAYTHLQPAQLTTVGKRATLWMNELLMDLEDLEYQMGNLKLLGQKGTTGTQASFMELFHGDEKKIEKLEQMIAEEMGFKQCVPVSGQTYSRKVDSRIVNVLGGIAQSCSKFSNDLRILANFKEMEEPFEKNQIGSSAMPYKRNPMRAERITSLSRYVMIDTLNPAFTAGTQWFERTLDDSANRRIAIPEAFLAVDAILALYNNIIGGLTLYPRIIAKHLSDELPFMATENILMYCVSKKGGDRQVLHEAIRQHSVAASKAVKLEGKENDLLDRILKDATFGLSKEELDSILDVKAFTGRAEKQVEEYISEVVDPLLESNKDRIGGTNAINV